MNEQQQFWRESFGDDYIVRNKSSSLAASNVVLFSDILKTLGTKPRNILEVGSNIGMNIIALRHLLPDSRFTGVEINATASKQLRALDVQVIEGAIEDVEINGQFDLVFTKGVLIHVNPNALENVYTKIFNASAKYILFIEYYSRNPEMIEYRGHKNKLFKRDFAGDFLDKFQQRTQLREVGFAYHRGSFPQDDLTWFLIEKEIND